MIYIVIGFLWLSLLIYLLMGGADFGAGILELFTREHNRSHLRKTAYRAIGPIWEANHMWLIIAIVVLFVGFPEIYSSISVYLHIPLVIMLLGIIARGTAFTFRNYDARKDQMQQVYNQIYVYSSFITPLFLGIIAATAVSGRMDPGAQSFLGAYIFDWLNWFPLAVGFFTVFLCAFLAAIFLIGEARDETSKGAFIRKSRMMIAGTLLFAGLTFLAALHEHIPLLHWILGSGYSITASTVALISLIAIFVMLDRKKVRGIRIAAGLMVTALLIASTYSHFPEIILLKDGTSLSLLKNCGPPMTIFTLGMALVIGSLFILPALFYLIYSFSTRSPQAGE